jgi:hypothetical protein
MKDIPKDIKKRVPDFDDFVYEDNKEEERLVAELRKKMSGLKVHARAKVTRSRVYCAAYHPEVTKDLIFFGGALLCLALDLLLMLLQTRRVLSVSGTLVRPQKKTKTRNRTRGKTVKVEDIGEYSYIGLQMQNPRSRA